eukprot:sb/3461245/
MIVGNKNLPSTIGICIANSLVHSTGSLVPIRCVNPLPCDVTLYKNRILASMFPIDQSYRVQTMAKLKGKYDSSIDIARLPDAKTEVQTIEEGQWEDIEQLYEQLKVDQLDISENSKSRVKQLIKQYNHCFSRHKFDLGEATFFEANIQLRKDYIARWIPSRPVPYNLKKHLDNEVQTLIDSGQIETCNTPSRWNSPIFLVKKPGSKENYRLIQDLRQLNANCLPDQFALPNVNSIMDQMTECNWLTSIDFTKGFNQIRLDQESRPLTAFSYNNTRHQWARLVMGQTSSSSQFARCMTMLFSKVPFQALICFLDDVLIGSDSEEDHIDKLQFVLERLSWGNIKISPSKTQLFKKQVKFLGHIISKKGISVDPTRINAITALDNPRTTKQLQRFLGALNYNRNFIRHFSKIAEPLYQLLRKGRKFEWNSKAQSAFEGLKEVLTKAPVLAIPQYDDPHDSYVLTIDSCKIGHGGTLTQQIDGKRRTISFWSKAVPQHQQKMGATRLEFLGLCHALKHYRIYLAGARTFKILTDCKALLSLKTLFRNEGSFIHRKLAELEQYNFTIEHTSGESADIQMADYLSRHPQKQSRSIQTQTEDSSQDKMIRVLTNSEKKLKEAITLKEIVEEYKHDSELSTIREWLESNSFPETLSSGKNSSELVHFWQSRDSLFLKDNILYKRFRDIKSGKDRNLVVVPSTLIERVLYSFHDNNGHPSAETSFHSSLTQFYFYKQRKHFKLYCQACLSCARSKQPHSFKKAPLKPIVYTEFGQCLAIDYLEYSKTPNSRGYTALLTMVDMFSNYLVCIPVKSTGAEEAIKVILHNWILRFGTPRTIMHDQGPAFTSKLFTATMQMFDIQDKHGVAWHCQTNGRCEAFNKKINTCIRTCLNEVQQRDFDKWIGYIVFTINCLKSTKTGVSANFVVFGKELVAPRDLFVPDNSRITEVLQGTETDSNNVQKRAVYDKFREVQNITRQVVLASAKRAKYMKANYDKHLKGPFFEAGQYCLLLIQPAKHKWQHRFRGPYKIVKKLSDWNYVVEIDGNTKIVNISKMKIYQPTKHSRDEFQNKSKDEKAQEPPTTDTEAESSSSSDDDDFPARFERKRTRSSPSDLPLRREKTPPRRGTRERKPTDRLTYTALGGDNTTQSPVMAEQPSSSEGKFLPATATPKTRKPKGPSYTAKEAAAYLKYKEEKRKLAKTRTNTS